MKHTPYTSKTKAADLITSDFNLLYIFERFGIKLGFGEATIEELCARYNLSCALFITLSNIYSFDDYCPKADALGKEEIPQIISYLRASHKHYMNSSLPTLHGNIHTMMEEYEETNRYILNKFFDDYDNEIKRHFEYEEQCVFPYIESRLASNSKDDTGYNIANFEESHTNVSEKFNDLKNIIIKYLPDSYTSEIRATVLREIFRIESDLRKHATVENRLLIPLVAKLEGENLH